MFMMMLMMFIFPKRRYNTERNNKSMILPPKRFLFTPWTKKLFSIFLKKVNEFWGEVTFTKESLRATRKVRDQTFSMHIKFSQKLS